MPSLDGATILMLEPDPDDQFITTSVISELAYPVQVEFVNYGHEVFGYLEQFYEQHHSYPKLILLSMPANVAEGAELLRRLKADKRYQHIPVIVLTGVRRASVIKECYELGASSCIQKPDSAKDTHAKIANFFKYWLETSELSS